MLPTIEAYETPDICSFFFVDKIIVDCKIIFQLMTHPKKEKT